MLKALIAGSAAPEEMAALARGQLRRKRAELIEALTGGVEEHHRFLLAMQLGRIEAIEADIAALDARVAERLLPHGAEMALLMTIPGVNWLVGAVMKAPTLQEEDRRRVCRERRTLMGERVRHVNRIKGLLFAQGVFGYEPLRKDRRERLEDLRTGGGRPLPGHLEGPGMPGPGPREGG